MPGQHPDQSDSGQQQTGRETPRWRIVLLTAGVISAVFMAGLIGLAAVLVSYGGDVLEQRVQNGVARGMEQGMERGGERMVQDMQNAMREFGESAFQSAREQQEQQTEAQETPEQEAQSEADQSVSLNDLVADPEPYRGEWVEVEGVVVRPQWAVPEGSGPGADVPGYLVPESAYTGSGSPSFSGGLVMLGSAGEDGAEIPEEGQRVRVLARVSVPDLSSLPFVGGMIRDSGFKLVRLFVKRTEVLGEADRGAGYDEN